MKKRVGIYANGWGNEYLQEIIKGVFSEAKKENADVFTFVEYSVPGGSDNDGEINIYRLPEMAAFDGVIFLANSFNDQRVLDFLQEEVGRTNVPAVCLEYVMDGVPTIRSDNYSGMYGLAEHLLTEHNAGRVLVIAGPEEHQESNERVQAVRDVYEKYGCTIPSENIVHGNWAKDSAQSILEQWLSEHKELPLAVICANDIMAQGVCERLLEKGIRVPEEVLVTGYDYLKEGQESYLPLASVSHEWKEMGRKAFDCLKAQWNKKKVSMDLCLKSKFLPGKSCGCRTNQKSEKNSAAETDEKQAKMDSITVDSHFRHIYIALRKADNESSFGKSLSELFGEDHLLEGNELMICVDKEFFYIEEKDANLLGCGYRDDFKMSCCLQGGVPQEQREIKRKDAIFYYSDLYEEPGLYFYLPLTTENKSLGFAVMSGNMNIMEDKYLYIWTRHMNQYMEQVRRNITIADLTEKLRISSVTDKLTVVYNRSGCEERSYPMLEKLYSEGREGVVMIIDIDRMKRINDYYGHVYGDLSLTIVASVLKREVPGDWITSRFGGDEFMVAGERREVNLEELTERIYQQVEKEKRQRKLEFPLSLSIGSIVVDTKTSFDMREIIQRADQMMYIVKKRHHRILDNG